MESEPIDEFSASNDQSPIKGKRSRRQSSEGGGGCAEFYSNSIPDSSTSGTTTEADDEDIAASCLILLARGGAASAASGKVGAGIYVYECKTCSRTFPSFQALGGHRASHKKTKSVADQKNYLPAPAPAADKSQQEGEEEVVQKVLNNATKTFPPLHININKHKVHQCSICGTEFASGQALGGHMRRHRSGNPTKTSNGLPGSSRTVLALDLNLPAPPEDAEFRQFAAANMVFSAAPALVDCYY